MGDSDIIYDLLRLSIPNDHPALYQYIKGGERSKAGAVNNIFASIDGLMNPPYSIGHIRTVIRRFLKDKKKEYKEGLFEPKPIY